MSNDQRDAKPKFAASRRRFLRSGALFGAGTALGLAMPRRAAAATRSLKVSTFGGYFEQGLKNHIFPAFTKASGIAVESIPQSESTAFLLQLQQAQKAGTLPMDVCVMPSVDLLRGRALKLWQNYDSTKVAALKSMPEQYVNRTPDGAVDGVGAMGWYATLVINTEEMKSPPTSWKSLWDPARKGVWGLPSGARGGLFEITAATFFGGYGVLDSREGIDQVMAKIAQLKSTAKLWWDNEGTMQTALENGDVGGGIYFNDVAHTMAKNGTPVLSIFPREGGLIDFGSWAVLAQSGRRAEAMELMAYTATPEAQSLLAAKANLVPLIDRKLLGVTAAEFDAVSSDVPPLHVDAAAIVRNEAYMEQLFTKTLAG